MNPKVFAHNEAIICANSGMFFKDPNSRDKHPFCETSRSERERKQAEVMNRNGTFGRKPPVDLHCLCMVP